MAIRSKDFRFFRDNAGGIVGRNAMTAIALARAEQAARDRDDWEFVWERDDDGADSLGDHDYWCAEARREEAGYDQYGNLEMHAHNTGGHEHEILWCALQDADRTILASLGGIIDPSNDYRRVIEAELAMEALADEARAASDLLRFVSAAYGVAVAS